MNRRDYWFGCGALLMLVLLSGCATQPANINDACSIYQEKGGWFNNWYDLAHEAQQQYGIPAYILMATVRQESGFRARAKPPRTRLLGFIPWKRPSDAYGYAQALSSTWEQYQQATDQPGADRNDFDDSIDFVGWYYARAHRINGMPRDDAYSLYLSYYLGTTGYARQAWRSRPGVRKAAAAVRSRSKRYARQTRNCDL